MAPNNKVAPTAETGTTIIASTGESYTSPPVSAGLLKNFKDNIYARGVTQTQKNIIFTERSHITITDVDGNRDEEIENVVTKMFSAKEVSLWSRIQQGWDDTFWYGPALVNPVWDWVDGVYTILKLRNLPAHSFDNEPSGTAETYSMLLPGITLNESGAVEFYQTKTAYADPVKLDNVVMITEPTSDNLTGASVMLPLVGVLSMLKFCWDTQMQQVNRTGAKVIFIKLTDPVGASTENGNVGDVEHANNILRKWGKDCAFALRGNMEIIDPGIKDDLTNLEVIAALNQMIIDYISPIDMLTSGNDGARLGGGDGERAEMIRRYIKSVHTWLEDAYSQFPQTYLDANGYVGYTARVVIPIPAPNTSEIDIRRADTGIRAKVLKPNAILRLLGEEQATEEELKEIEDYYARQTPATPQFNFSSGVATAAEADEIPDKSTESIMAVGDRLATDIIEALQNEE